MNHTTKRPPRNNINGVLLFDKPLGLSSNAALQRVKRLFNAKKAGHTGSLDPLATGMLPVCFGEATKFSRFLLDADKRYFVKVKLGVRTNTADSEGDIISERSVPDLTLEKLDRAFQSFRGEIDQVPPMYSALKHQGQPLYRLARKGIEIERKSRRVTIYHLQCMRYEDDTVEFEMHCSKGTYVRSVADDLGELLGCGAHVTVLRRLTVSHYPADQMVDWETLEKEDRKERYLLSIPTMLQHLPILNLSEVSAFYLSQGQAVLVPHAPTSGWVQLHSGDRFIGVGEIQENGQVAPRRLVAA